LESCETATAIGSILKQLAVCLFMEYLIFQTYSLLNF
jgi:hypothetical protein